MSKKPTSRTFGEVLRSAAGSLVPKSSQQAGPPTEPAGGNTAAATPAVEPVAPASEPIAIQPDPNPTATSPPSRVATTTDEEPSMTATPAPAVPP